MIYLFTGSRALVPRHWPTLLASIRVLGNHRDNHGYGAGLVFLSGMQYGVDTAAAGLAYDLYPEARHVLFKPAAPCNGSLPGLLPKAEVTNVRKGATPAESYRLRDQAMVDWVTGLLGSGKLRLATRSQCVAYPLKAEGSQRYSGTWVTVRMAKKAGIPVALHQLEVGATLVA